MNKNKQVLKHCPNFYKIINFDYFEEDDLSEKLIDIYHKYVFMVDTSDSKQVKRLEELDLILNKYIDDYFFRKELRAQMENIKVRKGTDIMEAIVSWIIDVFDNYNKALIYFEERGEELCRNMNIEGNYISKYIIEFKRPNGNRTYLKLGVKNIK